MAIYLKSNKYIMLKLLKMNTFICRPIISQSPVYMPIIRVLSTSSDVDDTTNLKPWTQIPGPKSYPVIGPLLSFLPGGELHNLKGTKMSQALYAKYGPIVRIDRMLDKKPIIFLFDAESSAQILRGENHMPIRKSSRSLEYYRKTKKNKPPGSATGLTTDQGKSWKEFRSTVNPVLLQPKIVKLYTSVIDEVALDMVERLKSLRDCKNMIPNLDTEMNLWSLESIAVIALGCRLRCFDGNVKKDFPVQQLIEINENVLKTRDELDMSPSLWKYYPTKTYKEGMEYYKKQEILARHFIYQAIKEFESDPKPDDQKGVLEKLVEINKEVALIMASDMMAAGIDSTSNSVLGALYLLASNPDKQSKLRAELKTNEEKRLYLKACIKEANRLMPVALGNKRETTRVYNILGYKIPKGIDVGFFHQDMSRMDKYFAEPHKYIPERWMVDKDDPLYSKNGHQFAYNPFGFGVRSCIGRRIAELEMETFIGRAIENFEIQWFGPPPNVEQTVINCLKGPFNFVFKDAQK